MIISSIFRLCIVTINNWCHRLIAIRYWWYLVVSCLDLIPRFPLTVTSPYPLFMNSKCSIFLVLCHFIKIITPEPSDLYHSIEMISSIVLSPSSPSKVQICLTLLCCIFRLGIFAWLEAQLMREKGSKN